MRARGNNVETMLLPRALVFGRAKDQLGKLCNESISCGILLL